MSTSVSHPVSVEPDGAVGNGPVLLDIGFRPAPVRTARSRWLPLGIATFAGLTCLGLATTTLFPAVTDRGSERERGAADTSARSDSPLDAHPPVALTALERSDATASGSWQGGATVVATTRLLPGRGTTRTVLVSGASTTDVSRIDVEIRIGNRVVSRSTVMPSAPDPDGTPVEVGAEALAGHRLVAWSALIDVPGVDAPPDGVAIATVSWPIPASSALGSTSLVLVLADRRGDLSTVTGWSTKP